MKKKSFAVAVTSLSVFIGQIFAQGNLTPPGAPAPTMKSLDQIEPRIPITFLPTNITVSGSYYLTTNLTGISGNNGIAIFTSDVTLDLGGFTITGVPGAAAGVSINGAQTNICVRNGTIRKWPGGGVGAFGIRYCHFSNLNIIGVGSLAFNAGAAGTVENCTVADSSSGINLDDGCRVTGCLSISNAAYGIGVQSKSAIVENCIVRSNVFGGIYLGSGGLVRNCIADHNGNSGIITEAGSVIDGCVSINNNSHGFLGTLSRYMNCHSVSNGFNGFRFNDACTAQSCSAEANFSPGFYLTDNGTVQDCLAAGNFGDGILVPGGSANILDCNLRANSGFGIELNGQAVVSGCLIENHQSGGIFVNTNNVVISGNTIRKNGAIGVYGGIYLNDPARGCRIENNICIGNTGYGIFANFVGSTNNIIIRNSATGNSTGNYNFNAANHFVFAAGSNVATNLNPYVNFSY